MLSVKACSEYIPVLKEQGWWFTGADRSGTVFFRNNVYQIPGLIISVGIILFHEPHPSGILTYSHLRFWQYCGNYSARRDFSDRINVRPVSSATKWNVVKAYYKEHGLRAYSQHEETLESRIPIRLKDLSLN
jgi:hypothetical protein